MTRPLPHRAISRGASTGALALLVIAPQLQACNGCSDTNLVARQPVPFDDTSYEPLTHDWGSWLSMGVSLEGAPVVSYFDRTKGALGFATATWTEDEELQWRHEKVDGYADESGFDAGNRGKYSTLGVAADGRVWIAYQDVTNKNLRYATRGPGEDVWESNNADVGGGAQPDAGLYANLALDAYGHPVVAHYDQGVGALRVARWNGSAFSGVVADEGVAPAGDTGADELVADVGMYPNMAISDSIEYIAYYDVANGDLKLAWGAAGSYSVEVVDAEGDVGQWPDIVVHDEQLHIAYHDVTNGDLKYAVGSPGSWSIETVDTADHVGADTHIWVSGGKPQIVYFDGRNNDMKQAWQSGDGWQSRTVTEDPGALGFHNEVVVSNGQTWAGTYDYTNRTLWFKTLD